MSYALNINRLRESTDQQLIEAHDTLATTTIVGVDYYLDELRRRDVERAMRSSHRLAVASFVLAATNLIAALAAVVIALD